MSTYEEFGKPANEVVSAIVGMIAMNEGLDAGDLNSLVWDTIRGACNRGRDAMVSGAISIDARVVGGSLYLDWHGKGEHSLHCNRPTESEVNYFTMEAVNV